VGIKMIQFGIETDGAFIGTGIGQIMLSILPYLLISAAGQIGSIGLRDGIYLLQNIIFYGPGNFFHIGKIPVYGTPVHSGSPGDFTYTGLKEAFLDKKRFGCGQNRLPLPVFMGFVPLCINIAFLCQNRTSSSDPVPITTYWCKTP